MYIEFLGLPGSGKSTIKKVLLQKLRTDGNGCHLSADEAFYHSSLSSIDNIFRLPLSLLPASIGKQLALKLINRSYMQHDAQNRFLAQHGRALSAFIDSDIYQKMQIKDRSLVIASFLEVGSLRECITAVAEENTVFFEEGLLQKSLMFVDHHNTSSADNTNVQSYLQSIPKPDLSIFITVDINDCHQRMLSREDGLTNRLKGADEKTILSFLERIDQHLHKVSQWLPENHHPVLYVDNNSDPLKAVDKIFESIKPSPEP